MKKKPLNIIRTTKRKKRHFQNHWKVDFNDHFYNKKTSWIIGENNKSLYLYNHQFLEKWLNFFRQFFCKIITSSEIIDLNYIFEHCKIIFRHRNVIFWHNSVCRENWIIKKRIAIHLTIKQYLTYNKKCLSAFWNYCYESGTFRVSSKKISIT